MDPTCKPTHALTAAEMMNRHVPTVPLQMSIRQAVCLIDPDRFSEAVVVDEYGRCVGILSAADVFRWVGAGCPEAALKPAEECPYQVRGRLPTGGRALICVLAHGSCPYQASYPGLGGSHTEVCMRPENADSPFGAMSCYMTPEIVTVRPEAPLPELVRRILETRADRLFVLDECHRPVGVVSAIDVLHAVASLEGAAPAQAPLSREPIRSGK